MPAPSGGFADKIGNRYEAHYVVWAALDVIDGDRRSLRWEGLGDEFSGIEYRSVLADGTVDVVQCKSNSDKNWTLAALSEKSVLQAIRSQLADAGAGRFTLILAGSAPDLSALAQRAAASSSIVAFEQALSAPLVLAFARLVTIWELSDTDDDKETARRWLSQTRVLEHCTPEAIDRMSERRCADLFDGPSAATRAAIREVLEGNLGKELTADLIISLLRADRYKIVPRDWGRLPDQVEAVHALRERFLGQLGRLLIRGRLIPRTEAETAINAISDPQGAKLILLHGAAGNGKSGVLFDIVRRLTESAVCVIPLRLDNQLPTGNLLRYSRESLQLPRTPVRCAARLSPGRKAVIVIDQLDAVRWAGVHSSSAWDVTLELLDASIREPNITVVLACRSFDMNDDPNLRSWRAQQVLAGRVQEIEVQPLDAKTVETLTKEGGGSVPTAQQVALLRNPLMLSIWCDLSDRGINLGGIAASSLLLTEHWKSVKRRIWNRHGISDEIAEQVAGEICQWAQSKGQLDFPGQLMTNQAAIEALASESFLERLDQSRFRVSHQRYLDHQIALSVYRATLKEHVSVAEWIKSTDQSLMRREQVRQVLALLRDGDIRSYLQTIEELLLSPGVREHIRDLVLRLLAEASPVLEGEAELVLRLASDDRWARRVRSRTLWNRSWWQLLIKRGVLQQWLIAERESDWQWAARALGLLADTDPELVSRELISLSKEGRLDADRRLHCLPMSIAHDTEDMARWRFRAQRRGQLRCESYQLVNASKESAFAALRYAAHLIRWHLAHLTHPGLMPKGPPDKLDRYSSHRSVVMKELKAIAAAVPEETWIFLAPHLQRHLRWLDRRHRGMKKEERRLPWDYPSRTFNSIIRRMLTTAAKALGSKDPSWLWATLTPFLKLRSRTAQRLSVAVIRSLPEPLPNAAVDWVVADLRRCGLEGSRFNLRRYWYGRGFVRHVWDASPTNRYRLVDAIRGFHDPYELRELRTRGEYVRAGRIESSCNKMGLPQYLLLSALPPLELDDDTRKRLEQWDSKFCISPERLRKARPRGWFLSRPRRWGPPPRERILRSMRDLIPASRMGIVPDRDWIEMAGKPWAERMSVRWKGGRVLPFETPDALTESTFRSAARSNPARFVQLAVRLPLDASDHWFETVLDAASRTEPENGSVGPEWRAASAQDIERCLDRVANREGKHLAMNLARLVRSRPDEAWSDRTIERVCEFAMSHEDPKPNEYSSHGGTGSFTAADVVSTSINCTRGVAVDAVESLMWKRPERREQFLRVAMKVVRDPHPAVRVAAIGLAGPLLNDLPDVAIGLLDTACSGDDVRVLHSRELSHLLQYLWWRPDPRVEAILRRMACSGLDEVEIMGAFYSTIIAFRSDRMQVDIERCATGNANQRKGVATALAKLTDPTPDGRKAAERLGRFFHDPDPNVSGTAAAVFRDEEVMRSSLGPQLAAWFVNSEQFARDPDDLMYPLKEFAGDLRPFHSMLSTVVARASEDMGELRGDFRRRGYAFADEATECILRMYSRAQAEGDLAIREWCLDQFDTLIGDGSHLGEQALAGLDVDA